MGKEVEKNDYHLIENFISPEYAKELSRYFLKNQIQDPERDLWGFISFGGHAEFFEDPEFKLESDPLDKIKEMLFFSYNFFLNQYDIEGDFTLNRSHANLMRSGSHLDSHKDYRDKYQAVEDLKNKTYIASLLINDDYEGGELVLGEDAEIVLKPKAGSLVLFPGYNTRHAVNKVTSGTRVNILSNFFDIKTGIEQ